MAKKKGKSSSKPQTPRRYNRGKKKPTQVEGQMTLAELGFYSDGNLHIKQPTTQPQKEEPKEEQKTPCNPIYARQYWYKIKIVVEKSAHVATKYGIYKYVRKVGDLKVLQNEFLWETDIDEQRKRQERIDAIEKKYQIIRDTWMNEEDTKKAYLAEYGGEEIDEFEFLVFLIKRENESIKRNLIACNQMAAKIKEEIPEFRLVSMDSKEEVEKIVRYFVTVPDFRDFVQKKYLGPALNQIGPDGKGFPTPISLLDMSEAYAEKMAKKAKKPKVKSQGREIRGLFS